MVFLLRSFLSIRKDAKKGSDCRASMWGERKGTHVGLSKLWLLFVPVSNQTGERRFLLGPLCIFPTLFFLNNSEMEIPSKKQSFGQGQCLEFLGLVYLVPLAF